MTPDTLLRSKIDELASYAVERRKEYGEWYEQLDLLYQDISDGLFGEAAKSGAWFLKIQSIKANRPKPDIESLRSEIEELIANQQQSIQQE